MSLIFSRDFILAVPPPVPNLSRSPSFGHENFYPVGTVTASSEDADHPAELASDGFSSTFWRTTAAAPHWIETQLAQAAPADYFAIAAHTLSGAGIEVTPQYHDGAVWQDLVAGVNLPTNAPTVWTFTEVTASRWRLLIEGAPNVIALGAVHVGKAMVPDSGLPRGWEPPSLNENVEYSSPVSVGGQILPRQIRRRGVETRVRLTALEYSAFARADWETFLEAAHARAFFLWWLYSSEAEVVYGGLERHSGSFARPTTVDLSVTIRGITR